MTDSSDQASALKTMVIKSNLSKTPKVFSLHQPCTEPLRGVVFAFGNFYMIHLKWKKGSLLIWGNLLRYIVPDTVYWVCCFHVSMSRRDLIDKMWLLVKSDSMFIVKALRSLIVCLGKGSVYTTTGSLKADCFEMQSFRERRRSSENMSKSADGLSLD